MAKRISLVAAKRSELGRTGVKRVRSNGKVPAVIYGNNSSTPLEVEGQAMLTALKAAGSSHAIIDLEIAGDKGTRMALLQKVQHDPLTDKILHVDLHEITENTKVRIEVPVHEIGEAEGIKLGGTLNHVMRILTIECLPKDIPAEIQVDVSSLNRGESIHVRDVKVPQGVKLITHGELIVFSIDEESATPEAEGAKPAAGEAPKAAPDAKAAPAAGAKAAPKAAAGKPAAKAAAGKS